MKHVLNEKRKRLEPTDTQCYYCGKKESTNMNDNYFIPLFKEADRTNIVVYRSVKFQKIKVGIPRCSECLKLHNDADSKASVYVLLAVIIISVIAFMAFGPLGILVLIPVGILGYAFQPSVEKKLVVKENILNKREGAEKNDTVRGFIISGWSFNQPMA